MGLRAPVRICGMVKRDRIPPTLPLWLSLVLASLLSGRLAAQTAQSPYAGTWVDPGLGGIVSRVVFSRLPRGRDLVATAYLACAGEERLAGTAIISIFVQPPYVVSCPVDEGLLSLTIAFEPPESLVVDSVLVPPGGAASLLGRERLQRQGLLVAVEEAVEEAVEDPEEDPVEDPVEDRPSGRESARMPWSRYPQARSSVASMQPDCDAAGAGRPRRPSSDGTGHKRPRLPWPAVATIPFQEPHAEAASAARRGSVSLQRSAASGEAAGRSARTQRSEEGLRGERSSRARAIQQGHGLDRSWRSGLDGRP